MDIDNVKGNYEKELLRYLYYDIINTDFGAIFFKGYIDEEQTKTIFRKVFGNNEDLFEQHKRNIFSWIYALQQIKQTIIDTKEELNLLEEDDMNKEDTFFSYYDYLKSFVQKQSDGLYYDTIKYFPDVFKLLIQVLEVRDIDIKVRLLINCAIAYIVIPNDIFPEAQDSSTGLIDDLFVGLYAINEIINGENRHLILNLEKEYSFLNVFEDLYKDVNNILSGYTDEILKLAGISK